MKTGPKPDEWLMQEVIRGEREQLEPLIHRHANLLLTFIQRMVGKSCSPVCIGDGVPCQCMNTELRCKLRTMAMRIVRGKIIHWAAHTCSPGKLGENCPAVF